MQRKIIIGYDPEHGGGDVLRFGELVCETLAAQPVVVTALPWPSYLMGLDDLQAQLDAEMRAPFDQVRSRLGDLEAITQAVASASPAQALHAAADQYDARMIVLGSCHRGPLGRTLAGSVGESALHGAPCALGVAPRGYDTREQTTLTRLAVAFDGSAESWAALETGIGLAERCHGQLTVLTVAELPRYGYSTSWSILTAAEFHDYEHEDKERLLELALGRIPADVTSDGRVLAGDAGGELAQASYQFDLLIAGSRAYGPLRRTLLGSTTRRLIASSESPVLILPRALGVDPLALRGAANGGVARTAA